MILRETPLKLLESYFNDRKQMVLRKVGFKLLSSERAICKGVQDTIMGPFLFVIYIDDLPETFALRTSIMQAQNLGLIAEQ